MLYLSNITRRAPHGKKEFGTRSSRWDYSLLSAGFTAGSKWDCWLRQKSDKIRQRCKERSIPDGLPIILNASLRKRRFPLLGQNSRIGGDRFSRLFVTGSQRSPRNLDSPISVLAGCQTEIRFIGLDHAPLHGPLVHSEIQPGLEYPPNSRFHPGRPSI